MTRAPGYEIEAEHRATLPDRAHDNRHRFQHCPTGSRGTVIIAAPYQCLIEDGAIKNVEAA